MGTSKILIDGVGIDLTQDTVAANRMLSGTKAHDSNGNAVTGNIQSKSAQTYTPGASAQTIAAGQYLSGAQTIAGDAGLTAENIKKGVQIFGVTGAYEGEAFAFVLVTYPEGSTVSCTNSSGNKDITNTQKLFYIQQGVVPFNCVVTATDGTQTTSKTVSIEYEGQGVNLSLTYELVLFDGDNGGDNTEVTGGWEAISGGNTLTVTETEILFTARIVERRCAFAVNPIPVQDYSKITFTGYTPASSTETDYQFFITTAKDNSKSVVVATVQAPRLASGDVFIDLSGLSLTEGVNYYVGLSNQSLSDNPTHLTKCILT